MVRKASQPSVWATGLSQKYMLGTDTTHAGVSTALLPSDGAAENIKVIANGHAFRDMDIVYISNSADAAGDAAPLAPSGQRFSTSKAPRKTLFTST